MNSESLEHLVIEPYIKGYSVLVVVLWIILEMLTFTERAHSDHQTIFPFILITSNILFERERLNKTHTHTHTQMMSFAIRYRADQV